MAVADVYDALRSQRPYKPGFSHDKTYAILTEGDGRSQPHHFDPQVLAVFRQRHASMREIFESFDASTAPAGDPALVPAS